MSEVGKFQVVRKGGYDIEEVNSYVRTAESRFQEIAAKEGAISSAIISAQMAADQMIADATNQSQQIKDEANKIHEEKMREGGEILQASENAAKAIRADAESEMLSKKRETEEYCNRIIKEAEGKVAEFNLQIVDKVAEVKKYISSQRDFTSNLKDDTARIIRAYLSTLEDGEMSKIVNVFDDLDQQMEKFGAGVSAE